MMPRQAKVAAFTLVLLTAAVLVANSMHGTRATTFAERGDRADGHSCPYGEAGCKAAAQSSPLLAELIGDNDFVFVILPGDSGDQAKSVQALADSALTNIRSRDLAATSLVLETSAAGHAELAGSFALESFPSVVAIGRSHRAAAVSGEITETKLLRAFVVASTPAPGCGDCDPSTCGQGQ